MSYSEKQKSISAKNGLNTQNDLILNILKNYYYENDYNKLDTIIPIINGHSQISLRLIDWFVTNYSKKYYTTYNVNNRRFPVYTEYRLKLKAYKKKRFDPFCRWDRINFPYKNDLHILTTIGQLNFFQWALQNNIIDYIKENKKTIEDDMNTRNNISTRKNNDNDVKTNNKTRKKRNELSISATKTIKKEDVEITIKFN
jgi:hypothetical protein